MVNGDKLLESWQRYKLVQNCARRIGHIIVPIMIPQPVGYDPYMIDISL